MSKTKTELFAEQITPDLITYLGDGTINSNQLARSIEYTGLEISDFDRLKMLHFVLYEDVIQYIERLPERLRRIKTEHRQVTEEVRGEIRGRIHWPQTLERRASLGYNDRTLFVIENPAIEIDIPENRVVKKLLAAIKEPLTEDIESIDQDWRARWDDADIVQLQQTLAQNIYLDALPSPVEINLSDRDLTTARRAREPLYYEGAELYRLYEDLINDRFHHEAVQELLRETIIAPTQGHKLFELFCVFAFIRRLRDLYPELQLQRVQPGKEQIAQLESSKERITVYYDEGGPLSFFERYPSSRKLEQEFDVPETIRRQARVYEDHERLISEFLSRGSNHTLYSGRPDFIAIRWTKDCGDDSIQQIIIGEAKYTRRNSTFSTGLRELLEYLQFARANGTLLFDKQLSKNDMYGVICTDGVQTETDNIDNIQHWTTADLKRMFE